MEPSAYLGVLGMTGLTAFIGIDEIGKPQEGETFVVSGAAGAVGSVAGQLAKARGARVVGIAGGPDKTALITDRLGFDAAVDYKAADWHDQLVAATPDGIDVDFENVGGDIMDAVFARLNLRARVALCGLISGYNDTDPPPGPRAFGNLLVNRVLVKGFIVLDHFGRAPEAAQELGGLMAAGKLTPLETVVEGFDQLPDGDQHAVRRRERRQARRQDRLRASVRSRPSRLLPQLPRTPAGPAGPRHEARVHARGHAPAANPEARVLADGSALPGEHLDHRSRPQPALEAAEAHGAVLGHDRPPPPRAAATTAVDRHADAGGGAHPEQLDFGAAAGDERTQANEREGPEQLERRRGDHDRPVDGRGRAVAVEHAQPDAVEARPERDRSRDRGRVVERPVVVEVPGVRDDRPVEVHRRGGDGDRAPRRRSWSRTTRVAAGCAR